MEIENRRTEDLPDEPEKQTSGGLYLPDTSQDRVQTGTVNKIGPGSLVEGTSSTTRKIPLREGDRILFNQFGMTDGKTYGKFILLYESDILAIIK